MIRKASSIIYILHLKLRLIFQVPLASGNEVLESTSFSTSPSDEEEGLGLGEGDSSTMPDSVDPTESLFKHQAKFFYQMKDYLLSQQSSLRQHLELLNATVASRKKKLTTISNRRQQQQQQQRFLNNSTGHGHHSVHLATKPKPDVNHVNPEIRGANNNHDLDLMNEFHSCSSTEKSGKFRIKNLLDL